MKKCSTFNAQKLILMEKSSHITDSGMFQVVTPGRGITSSNEDEGVDSTFALGELAQLTVNNDVENSYDVSEVFMPVV